MNVLLLDPAELDARRAVVRGRRARHALAVLGARAGDTLRAAVVGQGMAGATVLGADRDRLEVCLGELSPPPPPPQVDLVLALPRPKVLVRVLQAAAAAGVRRIDLVGAWRVDKAYFGSRKLDRDALRRELWLGCEQGAHPHLPEVFVHRLLMPFVRGQLTPRAERQDLIVLHPSAPAPLEAAYAPGRAGSVALIVGGEGGWIAREVETFQHIGAEVASLGTAVLRTEGAVVAALSQLALLRRLGRGAEP